MKKKMKKKMNYIKVSIMTNISYPLWKAIEEPIVIDETKEDYLWGYEELKNYYQDFDDEYPLKIEIEHHD